MAYSVIKIRNEINSLLYREFTCDTVADIEKLPTSVQRGTGSTNKTDNSSCAIGSKAFVIDGAREYMLGHDNVWHDITKNSGTSAPSETADIATNEEVNEMLNDLFTK